MIRLTSDRPGVYRFPWRRRAELAGYLDAHHPGWRERVTAAAQPLTEMSLDAARQRRALREIAQLGRAWWATGDPRYGEHFERFFLQTETGEVSTYANFTGEQLILDLDAALMLADCPGWSTAGRVAFFDHLFAMTEEAWSHVSSWRQTMAGPEGHNWYLHGMHGLVWMALLFPEWKRAAELGRKARSFVVEHMRAHYMADGGARETTLGYQAGSLTGLWDHAVYSQRNQLLAPWYVDHVAHATRFVLKLASPQGGVPSFGDSKHMPAQLTRLAALAAAVTGAPDFKAYAERFRVHQSDQRGETRGRLPLDVFWNVGPAGADTYAQIPDDTALETRSIMMPHTGYTAMRCSTPSGHENYLAVAHADRGRIVTSHGHNDAMSIELHAHGTRYIGEMGCAPYGKSAGRDYDLQTSAHSTLVIDGQEQAPVHTEWRWVGGRQVTPKVRRWVDTARYAFLHAAHEGYYAPESHGALHSRKILMLKPNAAIGLQETIWLVFDWIETQVASHDYAAYFHFATPASIDGQAIAAEGERGDRLRIEPAGPMSMAPARVADAGRDAYMREKGLEAESHPAFVYRAQGGRTTLAWALIASPVAGSSIEVHGQPAHLEGDSAAAGDGWAVSLTRGGDAPNLHVTLSHLEYDADIQGRYTSASGAMLIESAQADEPCYGLMRMADGVAGA